MPLATITTRSARGVTMIEVVLASVLLAMIGITMVSGLGYIHASHRRHEAMLGAAEMANRIMLQHLDDPTSLPSDALPIAYGARGELRYYWKVKIETVDLRLDPKGALAGAGRTSGIRLNDLLDVVTVSIWKEQVPNVNPANTGEPPDFMLKRLINPVATRNPDSMMKILHDPERTLEWLKQLGDSQGGG